VAESVLAELEELVSPTEAVKTMLKGVIEL
jgi:hypothetical protein